MTGSSSWPRRSPAWTSKGSVAVVALLLAVVVAGADSSDQAGMALLEKLGARLKAHPVWHATYHQEYVPAGMTLGEEAKGEVWLGWPDRALFRQGEPLQRVTGLEGRRVRLLDLEVQSCEDHQLSDEEWQRTPLVAVIDPRAALASFTVVGEAADRVALLPRRPGGVQRVELTLDKDGLPLQAVVVDPQGAVNRLSFSGWRAQDRSPAGGWLPQPPAGLDCIATQGDSAGDPG